LDTVTSGSVIFDGRRLESMKEPALARLRLTDMGFVFQDVHLLQNLSLLDNVLLSGFLSRQRPRREVVEQARELLDRVGLSGMETRSITQASGGQLQRVGICRALINEPKIVFGDEPTGALNSQASREIMDLLTEVNRRGTTLMVVTHDARVAARSSRVLLMKDGRIVSEQHPGPVPSGDRGAIDRREGQIADWLREMGV
jgi:putative ABC transport system ATP-binding protein